MSEKRPAVWVLYEEELEFSGCEQQHDFNYKSRAVLGVFDSLFAVEHSLIAGFPIKRYDLSLFVVHRVILNDKGISKDVTEDYPSLVAYNKKVLDGLFGY